MIFGSRRISLIAAKELKYQHVQYQRMNTYSEIFFLKYLILDNIEYDIIDLNI